MSGLLLDKEPADARFASPQLITQIANRELRNFDQAPMNATCLSTKSLNVTLLGKEEVLLMIDAMSPEERAQVSADWLARLHASSPQDPWTHCFSMVHRSTGTAVGMCSFKGPVTADGVVEIAYGVDPENRGNGYATEAAAALVIFAFGEHVPIVCAHTLPEINASTRVLTKCGFEFVKEVIDPEDGLVWRWEKCQAAEG